jgi:DHA1 family tetracycline resistance protein-like MFS transporter
VRETNSKSSIAFVLLTILIDTIGFGIIIPVLPKLVMELGQVDLPGAARIGGLLMVVFAALQFLFGPVIGNLSDAYGRRPVLLVSLFAFAVNYGLMGFSPSLTWLVAGRALTGIAGAVYGPANAYVADVSPPEKRAQGFGMVGAAFGLGFILGPALGGFLGEYGARVPFFAAAALAFANLLYGVFVLPESLPKERRRPFSLARANPLGALRTFRTDSTLFTLACAALVWQVAFHVFPSTWSYYMLAKFQMSPAQIGTTLSLSGVSMALVQGFLTGRIVGKIGEARTAPLGVLVGIFGFLFYAFAPERWMLYPMLAVGGFQGLAMPSINAMMSRRLGVDRQGELSGGIASIMGLASVVGPVLLTQTMAHYASPSAGTHFPGAAFLLSAGLGVVCFLLLFRRT